MPSATSAPRCSRRAGSMRRRGGMPRRCGCSMIRLTPSTWGSCSCNSTVIPRRKSFRQGVAFELQPTEVTIRARARLALAIGAQGRNKEALEQVESLFESNRDLPTVRTALCTLLVADGHTQRALALAHETAELQPTDARVYHKSRLGVLDRAGTGAGIGGVRACRNARNRRSGVERGSWSRLERGRTARPKPSRSSRRSWPGSPDPRAG
jgi:hypothetical protein